MPASHRRRTRRRTRGLTAALAALATAPAVLTGAAASASTGSAGAAELLSRSDGAAQASALEYWTPERMAAALPASADVDAAALAPAPASGAGAADTASGDPQPPADAVRTLAAEGLPSVVRRQRGTADVVTGDAVSVATPWRGEPAVTPKIGRLYFTQGGLPYECSASSVRSGNESVVVTAGHCLTERGRTSENVIYVPGLDGAAEPYGRWPAVRTFTTAEWLQEDQETPAALNHDVGFVVVGRHDGATLADTTGALDIAFGAALDRVTVFGYPAAGRSGDGYTLQHCTGWRFPDAGGTSDHGTLCDMGGGSSGGPWLSGFDPVVGTGTVTSVVSFSYSAAPERLYGPRLGDVERALHEQAAAVPVP
ncbi:trypsin-like serine peptidase [Kineococcus sp. G2]|uniref:trypsin-like serine peptidase n=1 Tax=Kineococcus sp. G2 TaxID=3127484 RepID=UPI00301C8F6C